MICRKNCLFQILEEWGLINNQETLRRGHKTYQIHAEQNTDLTKYKLSMSQAFPNICGVVHRSYQTHVEQDTGLTKQKWSRSKVLTHTCDVTHSFYQVHVEQDTDLSKYKWRRSQTLTYTCEVCRRSYQIHKNTQAYPDKCGIGHWPF